MSVISENSKLYTPLSEALEELRRRQGDSKLKARVREYFELYPCPPELTGGPRAVVAPPIVSPNLELKYFLDIREHLTIPSVFLEFREDKFVHLNFEKRYLGEMVFYRESRSGNKEISGSMRVVDFEKDQGKRMNEIITVTGENFVDFHHRLFSQYMPDVNINVHDFSDWFKNSRKFSSEIPYLRYLGLFLTDGLLFSNFITDSAIEDHQSTFTRTQVIPAFMKLSEIFGVKPLMVPIEPMETDSEAFWCYYPEEVRQLI